jgi:hypothetical protein
LENTQFFSSYIIIWYCLFCRTSFFEDVQCFGFQNSYLAYICLTYVERKEHDWSLKCHNWKLLSLIVIRLGHIVFPKLGSVSLLSSKMAFHMSAEISYLNSSKCFPSTLEIFNHPRWDICLIHVHFNQPKSFLLLVYYSFFAQSLQYIWKTKYI